MTLAEALLDAWALVAPVDCAGCGTPDRALCGSCVAQLRRPPELRRTPGGLQVAAALRYEGAVRRAVISLKEQQRTDIARALGRTLGSALAAMPGAEAVPVPTSRAAYRRRGYEPVVLLLRRAGARPVRVLRASRSTTPQKTLGVAERAANLAGAFAARGGLAGRSFVLVDDVMTTGATLDEAARALRAAGGNVVGAATLAFTPRLLPFRDNGPRAVLR